MIRKEVTATNAGPVFEEPYISLRRKEGRILTDGEVGLLPYKAGRHAQEWKIRQRSCERLKAYVASRDTVRTVLEVGCGNGWLSNQLACIPNVRVTGLDINSAELRQAMRVFGGKSNLRFIEGDLRYGILGDETYDVIVFASSIQYFPSVSEIVGASFTHLEPSGEIHILDSRFYRKEDVDAAKKRSQEYFSAMGFEAMADFYFHHALSDLEQFRYRILHRPGTLINKFLPNGNPFYWICLQP